MVECLCVQYHRTTRWRYPQMRTGQFPLSPGRDDGTRARRWDDARRRRCDSRRNGRDAYHQRGHYTNRERDPGWEQYLLTRETVVRVCGSTRERGLHTDRETRRWCFGRYIRLGWERLVRIVVSERQRRRGVVRRERKRVIDRIWNRLGRSVWWVVYRVES